MKELLLLFYFTLLTFSLQGQVFGGAGMTAVSEWQKKESVYSKKYFVSPHLGYKYNFGDGHNFEVYTTGNISKERSFIVGGFNLFANILPIVNTKNVEMGFHTGFGMNYNSWTELTDYNVNFRLNTRFDNVGVMGGVNVNVMETAYWGAVPEFYGRVIIYFKNN